MNQRLSATFEEMTAGVNGFNTKHPLGLSAVLNLIQQWTDPLITKAQVCELVKSTPYYNTRRNRKKAPDVFRFLKGAGVLVEAQDGHLIDHGRAAALLLSYNERSKQRSEEPQTPSEAQDCELPIRTLSEILPPSAPDPRDGFPYVGETTDGDLAKRRTILAATIAEAEEEMAAIDAEVNERRLAQIELLD